MTMMTWLADVLRDAGLPVREVVGWQTRGHGQMGEVLGVLAHHTAGPATGDFPSEKVVVNGRSDLPGPLANLGLTRNGTWVVIASGQAWHAGTGSVAWCPKNQGNAHLIGVEAESQGTCDDWTPQQRASYPRGVAAILRHFNLPASRAIGHKEWAVGRKIDPAYWDMTSFRADVAHWMNAANITKPGEDWFDMATKEDLAVVVNAAIDAKLGRTIWETTGTLPNRRGPGGSELKGGGQDSLWGYSINADGFGYRIEQLLNQVAARVGSGNSAPPVLTPADRTAIATEVANLLAARLAQ